MVGRRPREGLWVAGQDFVSNGRQPVAKHSADIGMPPGTLDDLLQAVGVDVADGQLIQVRGEAAAGLYLTARGHDQRLAWSLAVVFLEPFAVPIPAEPLRSLYRREVVPIQRDRQLR